MAERAASLRHIRGALVAFVLLTGAAVSLFVASQLFRAEQAQGYETEQRRFRSVSARYLSVDEEERIIREELPRFESLAAAGVIGSERRLDWLEGVRLAREAVALPQLELRMDSRALATLPYPVTSGPFQLRASRMHLAMGLVHEGNLPDLFDAIDARAPGLYTVTACRLSRLTESFASAALARNLAAECDLEWYTLDLPGGYADGR